MDKEGEGKPMEQTLEAMTEAQQKAERLLEMAYQTLEAARRSGSRKPRDAEVDASLMEAARWLEEFREALGRLVQREGGLRKVSSTVGVSHQHVSDIIHGVTVPSAMSVGKFISSYPDDLPPVTPDISGSLPRLSRHRDILSQPPEPSGNVRELEAGPDLMNVGLEARTERHTDIWPAVSVDRLMMDNGAMFVVLVTGDWMAPFLYKGDFVYMQSVSLVSEGDIVMVTQGPGMDCALRVYREYPDGPLLEGTNPDLYPPLKLSSEVRITGRAVGFARAGAPTLKLARNAERITPAI